MIVEYGSTNFKALWLEWLKEDPIHPQIPVHIRISGSRNVVAMIEADIPEVLICIKFGDKLPQNMEFILNDDEEGQASNIEEVALSNKFTYVIFYSIFKLKHSTLKHAGALAIKEAKEYYHNLGLKRFFTLSPIPTLTKDFTSIPTERIIKRYLEKGTNPVAKFHLQNGAKIHAINYDADMSELRKKESWGVMVNYDYCDYS